MSKIEPPKSPCFDCLNDFGAFVAKREPTPGGPFTAWVVCPHNQAVGLGSRDSAGITSWCIYSPVNEAQAKALIAQNVALAGVFATAIGTTKKPPLQ